MPENSTSSPRVAIVGGGLAGLAAAAVLCERGLQVELFESRRVLGGRAGSYRDEATGELIDHCQHVGMGCCTNLADFCRRVQIEACFRRDRTLYFFGPDGRQHRFAASAWLPAPLHLAPALLRLSYLSWRDKLAIGRTMLRLAASSPQDQPETPSIGAWLRARGQSPAALERFWNVVLVSALGESLDRCSLAAARKVFVDGFLANRRAYEVWVPTLPLGELYGARVAQWLQARGVQVHLQSSVKSLHGTARAIQSLDVAGEPRSFDQFVLAVPWRRVESLIPAANRGSWPLLADWMSISSSPITAIHLWFDRPIMNLPHAVLIDRLSQWLFAQGERSLPGDVKGRGQYYQVVISASRSLAGRDRETVVQEVVAELKAIFPAARDSRLRAWRMITEQEAVFSVRPGLDAIRPSPTTSIPNLYLAGDWTNTGWPATMEGAVRSGYRAAEQVLAALGRPERVTVSDLPRNPLVRWICGAANP